LAIGGGQLSPYTIRSTFFPFENSWASFASCWATTAAAWALPQPKLDAAHDLFEKDQIRAQNMEAIDHSTSPNGIKLKTSYLFS
jgi:hypothetical protein